MAGRAFLAGAVLLLSASTALTAQADRWLHVRVEDSGEKAETVSVNIPLSLVEQVLPLIHDERIKGGRVRLDGADLDGTDLRALWKAVRESKDAEYVTVEGRDDNVRVAKSGGYFLVKASGKGEKHERVDVKVTLGVVDALFSGGKDEVDVRAAVRALADLSDTDIVTVHDDESHVRIWIDSREPGK